MELPEDALTRRKTHHCKKHIRQCDKAPSDEVEAALEKRKRLGDDADACGADADKASSKVAMIEVLKQEVSALRQEKNLLSLKNAKLMQKLTKAKVSIARFKEQTGNLALTEIHTSSTDTHSDSHSDSTCA